MKQTINEVKTVTVCDQCGESVNYPDIYCEVCGKGKDYCMKCTTEIRVNVEPFNHGTWQVLEYRPNRDDVRRLCYVHLKEYLQSHPEVQEWDSKMKALRNDLLSRLKDFQMDLREIYREAPWNDDYGEEQDHLEILTSLIEKLTPKVNRPCYEETDWEYLLAHPTYWILLRKRTDLEQGWSIFSQKRPEPGQIITVSDDLKRLPRFTWTLAKADTPFEKCWIVMDIQDHPKGVPQCNVCKRFKANCKEVLPNGVSAELIWVCPECFLKYPNRGVPQ